ncbi:MAG: HDOD domain-containing protein [Verrucomicrobiales bacterium]|nr:HDOD domain-containing protein [Verrucomicrobiales bacterium]
MDSRSTQKRRILIVTPDPQAFRALQSSLEQLCPAWEAQLALDGSDALEQIDRDSYEVVLADESLLFGSGLQLLDVIWERQPGILRFLHTAEPSQELVMRCVWNSHRLFTETLTAEAVWGAIQRALEVEIWLANENTRKLVTRLRTFPILPTLYFKLLKELSSTDTSIETLATLIEQDLAISTKVIQVVNSSLYGVQRQVSDLKEAVQLLGFEAVKSLVLAIQVVASEDKVKPLYETIGDVWHHSLAVAALARQLATQFNPNDTALANEAYTAGLLHDLGKLVLESNLGETYRDALIHAQKQRIPAVQAEAEFLGATHAETGAHLAALWGLPRRVVQAIALHHAPAQANEKTFSPLTAVHIANNLEHETQTDGPPRTSDLDPSYVAQLGQKKVVEHWRITLRESAAAARPAPKQPQVGATKSVAGRKSVPFPRRKTLLRSGRSAKLVVLGVGGLMIVALAAYSLISPTSPILKLAPWLKQITPVRARTAEESPDNRTKPGELTPASATKEAQTASPDLAGLTLRGIYFQPPRSAALINGQTVFVGEKIEGATILAIETNSVRVSTNGKEHTLRLR